MPAAVPTATKQTRGVAPLLRENSHRRRHRHRDRPGLSGFPRDWLRLRGPGLGRELDSAARAPRALPFAESPHPAPRGPVAGQPCHGVETNFHWKLATAAAPRRAARRPRLSPLDRSEAAAPPPWKARPWARPLASPNRSL